MRANIGRVGTEGWDCGERVGIRGSRRMRSGRLGWGSVQRRGFFFGKAVGQ